MTINLTLLILAGLLWAIGIFLLLDRNLTRVLFGFILMGSGTNILLLAVGGPAGLAPIFEKGITPEEYSDPLPQAMILTSIVITLAIAAFMLAIIYRSWRLARADDVQDDTEDKLIASLTPEESKDSEDHITELESSDFDPEPAGSATSEERGS